MEVNEIVRKRGFKPSDRFDPQKAEVLTSLTKKILHLVWNLEYILKLSGRGQFSSHFQMGGDLLASDLILWIGRTKVWRRAWTPY